MLAATLITPEIGLAESIYHCRDSSGRFTECAGGGGGNVAQLSPLLQGYWDEVTLQETSVTGKVDNFLSECIESLELRGSRSLIAKAQRYRAFRYQSTSTVTFRRGNEFVNDYIDVVRVILEGKASNQLDGNIGYAYCDYSVQTGQAQYTLAMDWTVNYWHPRMREIDGFKIVRD